MCAPAVRCPGDESGRASGTLHGFVWAGVPCCCRGWWSVTESAPMRPVERRRGPTSDVGCSGFQMFPGAWRGRGEARGTCRPCAQLSLWAPEPCPTAAGKPCPVPKAQVLREGRLRTPLGRTSLEEPQPSRSPGADGTVPVSLWSPSHSDSQAFRLLEAPWLLSSG